MLDLSYLFFCVVVVNVFYIVSFVFIAYGLSLRGLLQSLIRALIRTEIPWFITVLSTIIVVLCFGGYAV